MNENKILASCIVISAKLSKKGKHKRTDLTGLVNFLRRIIKNKLSTNFSVAGSYRRKKPVVGDLEFLIEGVSIEKIFSALNKNDTVNRRGLLIRSILWKGPKKMALEISYKEIKSLQLEFRVCDKKSFGAMLLTMTGGKTNNIVMRAKAKKKGWKLNEYGLWKGETRIAGKTEEEIYYKMGIAYKEPQLRKD